MGTKPELVQARFKLRPEIAEWVNEEAEARMVGPDLIVNQALESWASNIPGGSMSGPIKSTPAPAPTPAPTSTRTKGPGSDKADKE